jgi:division/cell wall cluster transcriptional repressor MraZ
VASNLYYGNHERKLDYKGRLGIPEDLTALGDSWSRAVLVRATDGLADEPPYPCLFLYDVARWNELLQAAPLEQNMDANEERLFMHKVVADAATVDVDAMKRLTIPERLLGHADLKKQESVRIMGMFNHVEIWNPDIYDTYMGILEGLDVPVPSLFDLARRAAVRAVS